MDRTTSVHTAHLSWVGTEGPAAHGSPGVGCASWARSLDTADLPILRPTVDTIERLRANEDAVDAKLLGEVIAQDPLMTAKVLAYAAAVRRGREGGGAETVTSALVMLGITPFFMTFGPQRCVDDDLAPDARVRAGFSAALSRSHRAANFALAFAVQRMDHDATVIQQTALLHAFSELLLWLRAPALALEIAHRQEVDRALRSAVVQRDVMGVELSDLQVELMRRWALPELLVSVADGHRAAESPQARTVALAVRLARHTAGGWENPAVPDDIREIASLLHMSVEPALALVRDLDGS